MSKKPFTIILSTIVAASFCIRSFASIYDEYNTFDGGNSNGKIYAAQPGYEVNYIGHAYPGQSSETLTNNKFHGDNELEMQIPVRSTGNEYYGDTTVYIGSYGSGILTSNSDSFSTGEIGEYSHTSIIVENYESPSGTSNITNADFNVNTSLTAANVAAASSGGSVLNVNTSEFYGTTDLNADTINIENSTITQQVGSTADTQQIITNTAQTNTILSGWTNPINYIVGLLMFVKDNLAYVRYTTDSNARDITVNNYYSQSNYTLGSLNTYTYSIVDQHINRSLNTGYGNFRALLHYRLVELQELFYAYAELFNNWYYPLRVTSPLYFRTWDSDTESEENVNLARVLYDITYYTGHIMLSLDELLSDFNTFRSEFQTYKTQWFNKFDSYKTDWFAKFDLYRTAFSNFVTTWFSLFNNWSTLWNDIAIKIAIQQDNLTRYRISETQDVINISVGSLSGYYTLKENTMLMPSYNTSTHLFEFTTSTSYCDTLGLLMSNINRTKAYLYAYMLYLNDRSVSNSIANSVQSLSNNLASYQTAEQNLQNRVQTSISSFIPDIQLLGGFVALSWVSNYLQQVYISLGTYGTVIMIGLLLAVCMQFIGYFRYKY